MTAVDLSVVSVEQLLEEVARRCGSSYKPRTSRAGSGPGRQKHATKHEWAKARAEEIRVKYHAENDPSARALLMEEMGKFEYLAKRYKDQGL